MDVFTASAAWVAGSFAAGSVPFGWITGRLRGIDVRKAGSGNIGATNVFRTVGPRWGFLALACDVLKGLLPVAFARGSCAASGWEALPLACGAAAVAGHMFSPFMKFRGGKGVATAAGMLAALAPVLTAAAFLVFAAVFAATNYISLSSCTAAAFLAAATWVPRPPLAGPRAPLAQCVMITAIAVFVVWKHRSNIARLLAGTESKIYLTRRGREGRK